MHVAGLDPGLVEIFGQILGHPLGERGHQHPFAAPGPLLRFVDQVVDLALHRPDIHDRIDQAGRADHLVGENAAGLFQFPIAGRCGYEHGLRPHLVPFLEFQRPVIDAGRQPEAEFREDRFSRKVALVHAVKLRHRDVALVDEDDGVLGQVFEQGRRRLAGRAAGQIARIVLDAVAGAGRGQHLEIVGRALFEPLGLQQLALGVQRRQPLLQFDLDAGDGLAQRRLGRHIVAVGEDDDIVQRLHLLACQRIEFPDALDLVAEQRETPGPVFQMGREYLHGIAPGPECAAVEIGIVALVLQFDEPFQDILARDPVALLEARDHLRIGFDRTDTVDAGDRGDDDDIVPFEQRPGRRMAHPVDLLVDARFLLDIGVRPRHIGLGLVVVVIADEIFDRVVREEPLHLAIELRRQRFIGRQNQRRALHVLDDMRHGEGLARAGHAEQHLAALVVADTLGEIGDGLGLVAGRPVVRHHLDPAADAAAAQHRQPLRLQRWLFERERKIVGHGPTI